MPTRRRRAASRRAPIMSILLSERNTTMDNLTAASTAALAKRAEAGLAGAMSRSARCLRRSLVGEGAQCFLRSLTIGWPGAGRRGFLRSRGRESVEVGIVRAFLGLSGLSMSSSGTNPSWSLPGRRTTPSAQAGARWVGDGEAPSGVGADRVDLVARGHAPPRASTSPEDLEKIPGAANHVVELTRATRCRPGGPPLQPNTLAALPMPGEGGGFSSAARLRRSVHLNHGGPSAGIMGSIRIALGEQVVGADVDPDELVACRPVPQARRDLPHRHRSALTPTQPLR